MSPLEKRLFSSPAHFLIGLFVFLILSCMSRIYILDINIYQSYHLQTFLPLSRMYFHFIHGFLCYEKVLSLNSPICLF